MRVDREVEYHGLAHVVWRADRGSALAP
jgi:hypothetical protein